MREGEIDLSGLAMPILLRAGRPVSDEDLMRFSERNKPYKIERNKEGDLRIMTPIGGIGGTHERYITAMLYNWTEENGTGIDFSPNTGFNLPDGSCLSPDAAWITLDRWNSLTLEEQAGYPPLCPDFVVEVRSRTDARRVVEAKMQTWLDNGAKLAWLVEPVDGNVTIYRPGCAAETLERPETVIGTEPVAGFELRCTRLWTTP